MTGMSGAEQDHSAQIEIEAAQTQARMRAEAGDLPGARTLLERALKAGEDLLGRDHPRLASIMIDLATVAGELGNITEAQRQLRHAYGIVVTSAGPEHHSALVLEARLALATHRLGDPTDAYDQHLVDAGARVLGADHPAVLDAQERLGSGSGSGFPGPIYLPSAHAPGVFDRQANAGGYYPNANEGFANPDGHPASPQPNIQVWAEPPAPQPDIEVWPEPPPAPDRARSIRSGGVTVIASLGVAVLAAAAVVAFQIVSPGADAGAGPGATPLAGASIGADAPPSTGASATFDVATPPLTPATTTPTGTRSSPPTGIRLTDHGGSVTLAWQDPAAGQAPFIVAGGRRDALSSPLQTVPAGRTTVTIYGLNTGYDYCFTVAAVYSTDLIAPSMRTCTRRLSTANNP
jgi:hypothetical protein